MIAFTLTVAVAFCTLEVGKYLSYFKQNIETIYFSQFTELLNDIGNCIYTCAVVAYLPYLKCKYIETIYILNKKK